MLTVFMCDDNEILLEKFSADLNSIVEKNGLQISLRSFTSGESLLFEMSDDPNKADIIMLDVLMKSINGIETAKELRRLGCIAEIIFLTSSEEYVFDSFDANPSYYLLKNEASIEKLERVFLKAYNTASNKTKRVFQCESKGVTKLVAYDDIRYFEVVNRVINMYYKGGEFQFYSTIEALSDRLSNGDFVRTHRSFLVNVKYISNIHKDAVSISSGESVPMSGTYAKDTRMAIMKYHSS